MDSIAAVTKRDAATAEAQAVLTAARLRWRRTESGCQVAATGSRSSSGGCKQHAAAAAVPATSSFRRPCSPLVASAGPPATSAAASWSLASVLVEEREGDWGRVWSFHFSFLFFLVVVVVVEVFRLRPSSVVDVGRRFSSSRCFCLSLLLLVLGLSCSAFATESERTSRRSG